MRSVEHAARAGAGVISIIPVRGGNGALEELTARGDWQAPTLAMLEDALAESIQAVDAVVQVAPRSTGSVRPSKAFSIAATRSVSASLNSDGGM